MSMDRLAVLLAVGGIVLFVLLPTIVVLLTSERPPLKGPPSANGSGEGREARIGRQPAGRREQRRQ
jgi:hypothetical protein